MTLRRRRYLLNRNQRRRLSMTGAAALLVVASLAGCGGAGADGEPPPTAAMPAPIATPPAETAATPPPQPALQPENAPKKTYPAPETLNGLDADGLAGLLGAPRFKRRDDPAEIWQYRTEACALDVFLYRAGDIYRVRHFETRGRGPKPVAANDCFVSLLKAREQGRAG